MAIANFLKKFTRKHRGELRDVEEAASEDGLEWDNKDIMPFMGDTFPAFPQPPSQGREGREGGEGPREVEAEMRNAGEVVEEQEEQESVSSFWTSTESSGFVQRPVLLTSKRRWRLSLQQHGLVVTSVMLLAAVAAFLPMLLLPMGAGQGAWPVSDNVTCHSGQASSYQRFLRVGRTVALVAIIPMVAGVGGALALNTLQLLALWRHPLLSAIVCYGTAVIYVPYLAVMPYKCAASSTTATLAFCLAFLQVFVLLAVPLLQREEGVEEDLRKEKAARKTEAEEEERLREAATLLDPAVCSKYYSSTWLPQDPQ